ncbi:hypothetical protein [Aromatoleum aromaticum]|nr:hypothetical protein [Aromatoleum aromaticum]
MRFALPHAGDYHEMLHGDEPVPGVEAGGIRTLRVPSNYGRVWLLRA